MSTRTIPLLHKKSKWQILFLCFCFTLLSVYPIYKNFYNGRAVTTYERHIALVEGRSEYFNPWQYRMLCPLIIEGLVWVYDHTIEKVYSFDEKFKYQFTATSEPTPETKEFLELLQTKGAIKYMIVFLFFRFLLNFLVFSLAFLFWHYFIQNKWLILFGLTFLSLGMGNAVIASDLTFNTYLDNVFYLLAACLIVYKANPNWLLALVPLSAFNRETSMLIPFLYFISHIDFTQFQLRLSNLRLIKFPKRTIWYRTSALYALFFAVFFSIRAYYGYQAPQVWKVPAGLDMVKLNLFSTVAVKSYIEMLGVFSILPFIICYKFRTFPLLLQVWFIGIVPAWFVVHFYSVVVYQTRLFLVPTVLVFIPMVLWLIAKSDKREEKVKTSVSKSNFSIPNSELQLQ